MQNNKGHNLNQSTIYQKSLDIFRLTRSIAAYVTNDKSINKMYLSKSTPDKYAHILVMDSLGLVPKIAETEIQENPKLKLKYAKSLQYFIDSLYIIPFKITYETHIIHFSLIHFRIYFCTKND